jgi:hypothetical protein
MTCLQRLHDHHHKNSNVLLLIPLAAGIVLAFSCSRPGQFTPALRSPFKVGSHPWSMVVGDLNGDGILDLAIANWGDDHVSVLIGNGLGGFTTSPTSPFKVGSHPRAMAVGDFNGDGNPDLAIGNEHSNNITVLLGNPKGHFSEAPGSPFKTGARDNFLLGPWPISLALGDFNADSKLDLAVTNPKDDNVSILLGNGQGWFNAAPGSPFKTGSSPWSVAAGDFNKDDKLDLAIANWGDNHVTVLIGNGLGGFSASSNSPFKVGSHPSSVVVGDCNGDGRLDLITANAKDNNLSILLGNGSGSFTASLGSPVPKWASLNPFVGQWPNSVAVGDLNGDDKLDLAFANYSNNVTISLGDGMGGFTGFMDNIMFRAGAVARSVVVGDFNRDGKLDLAWVNEGDDNVTVMLNGSFGSRKDSVADN